ncbi:MAG: MATE family efflux transporter [Cellvibrio sp.]
MSSLNLDHPEIPTHLSKGPRLFHELKTLSVLGGPMLIAQLAQMCSGVVDTIMAGHASAVDLAGVGIATSLWVPFLLFFTGTLCALQPTISGQHGSGDHAKIIHTTWQGLYIALIGTLLMIIGVLNIDPILPILQLDEATARVVTGYLAAFSWGIPALMLLNTLRGLTDGLGKTRVVMVFFLLSAIVNIPLNYLFIYGHDFGFFELPAMGGIGCGWATSIANWIALIGLIIYLNTSKSFRNFHLIKERCKPALQDIKQLLALGLPIGITMFVEVSMFCMIALFLAPLGAEVVAGHQIVLNVVSVFFMIPLSIGMALTLRIAFLVGAQDAQGARLVAKYAVLLALLIACVNAPILFFGRELIAAIYTSDKVVQAIAIDLLIFGAIFQIADVIQVTMINVQRGYKDTKIPMVMMLLAFWGICLPLGYVLTFKDWLVAPMGAPGFWIALIIGLIVAAILLSCRVYSFKPKTALAH